MADKSPYLLPSAQGTGSQPESKTPLTIEQRIISRLSAPGTADIIRAANPANPANTGNAADRSKYACYFYPKYDENDTIYFYYAEYPPRPTRDGPPPKLHVLPQANNVNSATLPTVGPSTANPDETVKDIIDGALVHGPKRVNENSGGRVLVAETGDLRELAAHRFQRYQDRYEGFMLHGRTEEEDELDKQVNPRYYANKLWITRLY